MAFPLNIIVSSTIKDKKIIWGLGQSKNLLQYRLPEMVNQWTGMDGSIVAPLLNIIAHQKEGSTLG